jgi:hypothetical protein
MKFIPHTSNQHFNYPSTVTMTESNIAGDYFEQFGRVCVGSLQRVQAVKG